MSKYLVVAGVNLAEFGVVASGEGTFDAAARDVEVVPVAGRNGDLMRDMGRYKNITVKYPMSIAKSFILNAAGLREFLSGLVGYQRIEDGYYPECFRLGKFEGPVEFSAGTLCRYGEATLSFNCKPQRFLISGELSLPFMEPGTILNPTNQIALPKIVVYGTGAGEVNINGTTVRIDAITDPIILDCEIENAYSEVEGSAAVNQNGSIYAPKFPTLSPGTNTVSFSGDITKLEITPRWWTL